MTDIQRIHKIVGTMFSGNFYELYPSDEEIAKSYELLSLAGVNNPSTIEIPVHWSGLLVIRFTLAEYSDQVVFCLSCYTNSKGFNVHLLLDTLNICAAPTGSGYTGITLIHQINKVSTVNTKEKSGVKK